MRRVIPVVLGFVMLSAADAAAVDTLEVRVRGIGGPADSIRLKVGGRGSPRA